MILEYYKYDASSVKQLKNFIKRCRSYLKSDSNLLWVALQSNQLADTAFNVQADFKEELKTMKMDLKKSGWILPTLKTNMRNQINISKINVEGTPGYDMQTCIKKLKAETNLVGDIPIFIKVNYKSDWNKKKNTILKYCIEEINKKDNKNIVILFDDSDGFKDIGKDLKGLIKDKTIVEYPLKQDKVKGISNVKDFIEKDNHILVTPQRYFNGCEASNIIFLSHFEQGMRNSLLRGVKNITCVKVANLAKIEGMKEDNRFD